MSFSAILGVPLRWMGVPAQIQISLAVRGDPEGKLTACVTSLQNVQCSSHISLAQSYQRLRSLGTDVHVLLQNDLINQDPNISLLQRTEPEPRTSTQ